MASAKELNPNAAEFFFAPQNGYVFNMSPSCYSTPPPVAPLDNPYMFYCSESILISRDYFPFLSTYSFPFPTTHFERSFQLLPTTHQSAVHDQPRLAELLHGQEVEEAQDVVADEATADQKIVPALRVVRNHHTSLKGGLSKYQRWFDRKMGRSHGSSRITSSRTRQEWKPAALKSVKNDGNNWNMCKSTTTFSFRRSFMKKRFFEVMPIAKNGEGTTIMIRNIPNKYSRDLLMSFLDNHCAKENRKSAEGGDESESAFDFLYLPIDFWTGMNKGYAFVNFTNPKAVWKFYLAAHCQTWDAFQSTKIREIAYARIQGKDDLVDHFDTMRFPCDWEDVLPIYFIPPRDGSEKAVEKTLIGRLEGWNATGVMAPRHKVKHIQNVKGA